MQMKELHLGDVLSITTKHLVSPRHMSGVSDILNFMTRDKLFDFQLPRACDECRPYLLEQFPQLDTPEMDFAIGELIEILKIPNGKKEPDKLILGWLSKLTSGGYEVTCEEMLKVKPIPKGIHVIRNPTVEAMEMMGGPEVTVVS